MEFSPLLQVCSDNMPKLTCTKTVCSHKWLTYIRHITWESQTHAKLQFLSTQKDSWKFVCPWTEATMSFLFKCKLALLYCYYRKTSSYFHQWTNLLAWQYPMQSLPALNWLGVVGGYVRNPYREISKLWLSLYFKPNWLSKYRSKIMKMKVPRLPSQVELATKWPNH